MSPFAEPSGDCSAERDMQVLFALPDAPWPEPGSLVGHSPGGRIVWNVTGCYL